LTILDIPVESQDVEISFSSQDTSKKSVEVFALAVLQWMNMNQTPKLVAMKYWVFHAFVYNVTWTVVQHFIGVTSRSESCILVNLQL
jgi:hypothetical protein